MSDTSAWPMNRGEIGLDKGPKSPNLGYGPFPCPKAQISSQIHPSGIGNDTVRLVCVRLGCLKHAGRAKNQKPQPGKSLLVPFARRDAAIVAFGEKGKKNASRESPTSRPCSERNIAVQTSALNAQNRYEAYLHRPCTSSMTCFTRAMRRYLSLQSRWKCTQKIPAWSFVFIGSDGVLLTPKKTTLASKITGW